MNSYEAHIECKCSEYGLIDVFNFLDAVFHKEHTFQAESDWIPSFEFRLLEVEGRDRRPARLLSGSAPSATEYFLHFEQGDLDRTRIILTITIEKDTDLDVFTYRYLFLVMYKLLRKQDQAYLDCPDTYYHKVGSYFFLQTLFQAPEKLRWSSAGKEKKLPRRFSLSSEWLPAIYLSNRTSDLYRVLANPLFKDVKELEAALQPCGGDIGRLDFTRDDELWKKPIQEQYVSCLERYFTGWLNGMLTEAGIEERLCSTPGITQLLFALMCGKIWEKKNLPTRHDFEKLLDICCDFGDCILQVAENIVSHTEGGVLSVRINDNWDKIKDVFQVKDPKSVHWYMRISLVDFSRGSILDNVKEKSGVDGLTLPHVFMDPKEPDGVSREAYRGAAEEYEKYLNKSEQIIHHYGLAVFRNVVNQYGGCFTVKSSTRHTVAAEERYAPDSESTLYNGVEQDAPHIPGSEYDILLPLNKKLLEEQQRPSNPSVLLKPKYIVPSVSRKVVFEEGLSDHFNSPLSKVVRAAMGAKTLGYQQMKERVVKESAQDLADKLLKDGPEKIENSVFYFYLSDITERVFGRAEIVAKVILQTIAELKSRTGRRNNEQEWLYLVLYGLSESKLVQFTRQFAFFYHRREGNRLMQGCQMYVVSENYQAEVMFAGVRLSIISDYCRSRRLVTGTSPGISELLAHIAGKEDADAGGHEEIVAFPFELLNRMETDETKKKIVLSQHNKWYHKNLETILKNDIHGGDLGCCLEDVHVRVGGVHLNTFFEGQLLFANLYWYQIFAHYICETVLDDEDAGKIDKDAAILLYGYETYSEQMLFAAAQKLREKGHRVYYTIFENPKYITATELSEQRVRYVDQLLDATVQKLCVIYLYGIGTTLSTISRKMNVQLEYAFQKKGRKELLDNAYKKGLVIVQISDEEQLPCDRENYTVPCQSAELDFLTDKVCSYLVEIPTKWYSTKECPYCLRAESYRSERPLIQTNETSTVPMILIKPKEKTPSKIRFKQDGNYTQSFLQNPDSAQYLYYSHLNRGENHYQFYVRTAALLNDCLQRDDKQLVAWFKEIREKEVEDKREKGATQINIIVSPQHFSNESLVAAVNDRVFGGEAYIINFNVKKEFRDSFVAKFQNYHSALEMLYRDGERVGLELNFYYVDDSILTGGTFSRAKSLVSSMLGEFAGMSGGKAGEETRGISVNLFKGIILLVNRNSKQTMCNYFSQASLKEDENGYLLLPVYTFIELNTPAIRSYGDSCPICNKVALIQILEKESSLTYVERHWREKAQYHGLKKLSNAKADKIKKDSEHQGDQFYQTRGLRRLQCSETVWALLKDGNMTRENAYEILESKIHSYLCQLKRPEEQVEYLISYLKVISREHVVFQEVIQPAAFQLLLSIFSVFIEDNENTDGMLCRTVHALVRDPKHPNLAYTLYKIVIARLCTMGSVVFCRKEQLNACLETGLDLEERARKESGKEVEPFSEFLCIQIKKMLFITRDCASRVEELQHVLEQCIRSELERGE